MKIEIKDAQAPALQGAGWALYHPVEGAAAVIVVQGSEPMSEADRDALLRHVEAVQEACWLGLPPFAVEVLVEHDRADAEIEAAVDRLVAENPQVGPSDEQDDVVEEQEPEPQPATKRRRK